MQGADDQDVAMAEFPCEHRFLVVVAVMLVTGRSPRYIRKNGSIKYKRQDNRRPLNHYARLYPDNVALKHTREGSNQSCITVDLTHWGFCMLELMVHSTINSEQSNAGLFVSLVLLVFL